MAIERYNRLIQNTVVLHVVLGDFNDIIDNKIDCLPSTEQPGSQFLIQLLQLGLYDVCRALYLNTELFTHEKWDKNKDKSSPISRSRIDQIWITHKADVIPENFTETLDRKIEVWDFQQLIDEFNHEIQLGYETNNDEEKIRYKFNEIWNNIMSTISIAVNIELPMKTVKYLESRNIRHKLSFVDKTMRHITKLESLMRKINKDQGFIDNKDDQWINFWLNRFNKYNKDYNRKEYDKFIDNHKKITIPTYGLFTQQLRKIQDSIENQCNIIHSDIPKWLHSTQDNVKEHIIIDRAVISNENEELMQKDTFAGILQKRNIKTIEQDVFWSNIYRPKREFTKCMANLMDEITIGEWHQTLELINTNSASSLSGIGYAIIKHFSDKSSYILLKFINMALKIGVVPD
ncbi:hypothetical protein C1646_764962 [Rhizophagus diaphanus]|nr:hypothetical protein C1646_764962 [Rhizophagus diaphanus] [Rhizophagus sp. MUCL 43196]